MIIVSQDKKTIINFDNIVKIWLENPLDDDKDTEIIAESDDIMETIGYYTTEERAKEVLKDLILRYEAIELKKTDSPEKEGYTLSDYTPVYEMPVEKVDDK